MTRTVAREIAVRLCFALSQSGADALCALDSFFDSEYYATLGAEDALFAEYPDDKQLEYIRTVVLGVAERKAEADELIEKYSKGWRLSRISLIAAAILRVALFEVVHMDFIPDRAAINEAIELAKAYEEPETAAFINGILGSFMRADGANAPEDA